MSKHFDEVLKNRKSVRVYANKLIKQTIILEILSAGLSAPSGKNGQPWRFIIVQKDRSLLENLSKLTAYDCFVKTADALIVVLLDKTVSYNYIKDCQAIGACIQNMLLKATEQGIGACWIGEILNRDIFVKKLLGLGNQYDLMAVITLGYSNETNTTSPIKKTLYDVLIEYK